MSANGIKLNMEKTEWLWTGTMSNLNRLPKSALQLKLGNDTIDVADAVRVLGVLVTPDLCLDKHVTAVSAKCFFQLRQLRRVRCSLNDESVATLVHAFVTSRIDYCNRLLAGAPKVVTDKLQRVMNSAARIVANMQKFDCDLTHVRRDILHWLDVPERVTFKLCMAVYKCLHGMGPIYLSEMFRPISSVAGRCHLRSADRGQQLVVPCYRLTTAGRRAFICAGPSAWNSLPEYLKDESLVLDSFMHSLKCFLFAVY